MRVTTDTKSKCIDNLSQNEGCKTIIKTSKSLMLCIPVCLLITSSTKDFRFGERCFVFIFSLWPLFKKNSKNCSKVTCFAHTAAHIWTYKHADDHFSMKLQQNLSLFMHCFFVLCFCPKSHPGSTRSLTGQCLVASGWVGTAQIWHLRMCTCMSTTLQEAMCEHVKWLVFLFVVFFFF